MALLKMIAESIGLIALLAGLIYLKYRQQRWINDQRNHKADVQTLFDGEK